jgi:hypothetical protein
MKTLRTFLCLTLVAFFLAPSSNLQAAAPATAEQNQAYAQQMAQQHDAFMASLEAKYGHRMMKRVAKLEKLFAKKKSQGGEKVDFKSEPDKWMWFWIFGWGAAIVFSIIGFGVPGFYWLGYLCGLAGTVCLIIWLLKKTGNM